MKRYEYGRIKVLGESLAANEVDQAAINQIMQGGESILKSTPPVKKADWMRDAMMKMDMLLDSQTRQTVREGCACCLGGKREQLSKEIAKKHDTLEERIAAANETPFVFGHSVAMQADGRILVSFSPDGEPEYRCVCLPQVKEPLPITYCYCCGGHVKHHMQNATGRTLALTVRSSALSSGGKLPCSFLFALQEN